MKLVRCNECLDIVKLVLTEKRICHCGKSGGYYKDSLNAVYWGPATPLGFDGASWNDALRNQPKSGPEGALFTAFIIPKKCPTMVKVRKPRSTRK